MATIQDVANYVNLSVTTVSRVINNHPYVSDEKRALVQEAIKELNYTPSAVAQQMRTKTTGMVGVIVPNIKNPFFASFVYAIEQSASKENYKILIFQSLGDLEREVIFLELLNKKQLDGIIMYTFENKENIIEKYYKKGNIVICNKYPNTLNIPMVKLDQKKAAYLGTTHLVAKGRKKIAYSTGSKFTEVENDIRYEGFIQALNEHKLSPTAHFYERLTVEDGKNIMKEIISNPPNTFDAIFTGSDEVAVGIVVEANRLNIEIPKELSVLGFDDQQISRVVQPNLTTLRQPVEKMGAAAFELFIAQHQGKRDQRLRELDIELIVREST